MSIDPRPSPSKDGVVTQAVPRKFLFNESFDTGSGKSNAEKEKPKPVYTEEQMQAFRRESYDEGFSEGSKALQDEEFLRLRALMLNVERHLHQLTQAGLDIWQNQLAEMQEVALVIARKILPAYTQKYGTLEIEAILSRIIGEMSHEPRLVIRVSPENFETMDQKIHEITLQKAYAGKVIVLSDDEFGTSDCRVEWADGGIDRDLRSLWYDIDRILEEGTGLDTAELSAQDVAVAQDGNMAQEPAFLDQSAAQDLDVSSDMGVEAGGEAQSRISEESDFMLEDQKQEKVAPIPEDKKSEDEKLEEQKQGQVAPLSGEAQQQQKNQDEPKDSGEEK